jgi:hypothetical protein
MSTQTDDQPVDATAGPGDGDSAAAADGLDRPDADAESTGTVVSGSVVAGPFLERTEDAVFHEGGLPGRGVGDTLFTRSGLFLPDGRRVGTKATFGTSTRRTNGDEHVADLLETLTFVDGSTVRCRGRVNLSAFERHDDDIVLEVGEGTGALWGWRGEQRTVRTDGPPSQSRLTTFTLSCPDVGGAGSGPVRLPPFTADPPSLLVDGLATVSAHAEGGPVRVALDPDGADPDEELAGALYLVAVPGDGGPAPVLARRLSADQLPTGGTPGPEPTALAGYVVMATPVGRRRGLVGVVDVDGTEMAATVEVPQAGGPALTRVLTEPGRVAWGADRGLLELVPLGVIGHLA